MAAIGIPAEGDVLSSAMAAAALLDAGTTALVAGGPGIVEALEARGITATREGDADAVLVGFHRDFEFERLTVASGAVRRGARLIGTNDDATYPTPEGEIPGGGSILAAVAYASSVEPTVAGKPFQPMADAVQALVGAGPHTMVGDRPSTDGRFATELGCRYAQVWSGVTAAGTVVDPAPAIVAADLAAVADRLLASSARA